MEILGSVKLDKNYRYRDFYSIFNGNHIISKRNDFDYSLYSSDIINNTVHFEKQNINGSQTELEGNYNPSRVLDYTRYNKYILADRDTKNHIYSSNSLYEVGSYNKRMKTSNLDFKGVNNDNLHDDNCLYIYEDNKLRITDRSIENIIAEYSEDIDFKRFQSLTVIHSASNGSASALGSYFVYLTSSELQILKWDGTDITISSLVFPEPIDDSTPYLQKLDSRIDVSVINDIEYCNTASFAFACTGLKDETYFVHIEINKNDGIHKQEILQNVQETNKIDRSDYSTITDVNTRNPHRETKQYLKSLSIAEE